jgi:hypothetical protein
VRHEPRGRDVVGLLLLRHLDVFFSIARRFLAVKGRTEGTKLSET